MTRNLLVLAALACPAAAAFAADVPAAVDPSRIPAYRLLAPGLAVGGQPTAEALTTLGALGFRTIVNLRPENEALPTERALVEAQGLRYLSVPMTAQTFSLADAQVIEALLADPAAAPVLLHCASSNRVGGVWAVVQARRGAPLEEALAAGTAAGLHSDAMRAAVQRVLGVAARPAVTPAAPPAAPPH